VEVGAYEPEGRGEGRKVKGEGRKGKDSKEEWGSRNGLEVALPLFKS